MYLHIYYQKRFYGKNMKNKILTRNSFNCYLKEISDKQQNIDQNIMITYKNII